MSNDLINNFVETKKANSKFISLGDNESVRVLRLKDIRQVEAMGFGGEPKEVLRLVCDVETKDGIREKTFDNGTQRFALELQSKGVKLNTSFVLTRNGLATKTRYTVTEVTLLPDRGNIGAAIGAAPTTAAPAAPAAPASSELPSL